MTDHIGDANNMVQAQRAKAEDLYASLQARSVVLGGCDDQETDEWCIVAIAAALAKARQDALGEVMRLHKEWLEGQHSGMFSAILDRLAREGVR